MPFVGLKNIERAAGSKRIRLAPLGSNVPPQLKKPPVLGRMAIRVKSYASRMFWP